MPRSFLITNRRYDLTPPPPPPHTILTMAPVPIPPAFAFIFHPDVQEEAEDLTVHKRRTTLDSCPETTVAGSAEDRSLPAEEQKTVTLKQGMMKGLLSPPTSLSGSSGSDSLASVSPGGSDASALHLLTGESHVCLECGKRYSTSSNLARHRQTHRSVTDKKARKCPHCEKVYVSMPAYSMHVRTHSQGCQCRFCGKCFSRPWLLQGHIRTHTGEKPFKCNICSKAFADKSNLRAHVQTHSTSKPYVCERCGKAFALKSYLYKHEESSCMRMHRRESHHRRTSNTNIAIRTMDARHESQPPSSAAEDEEDEEEEDAAQEEISSSGRSSSSPSPTVSSASSQFMHPRKAFVLQYTASLLQLQSMPHSP